jgi:hypothetical protein
VRVAKVIDAGEQGSELFSIGDRTGSEKAH